MMKKEDTVRVIAACADCSEMAAENIGALRSVTRKGEDGRDEPGLIGDITYVKGAVSYFAKKGFRVDLTGYGKEDCWLAFRFYVSDPTALTGSGQIELASSGRCDVNELNWNGLGRLEKGWNEYLLHFSDAGMSGGETDLSNINWFRFYFYLKKDATVGISDLRVIVLPKEGFLLSSFDGQDGRYALTGAEGFSEGDSLRIVPNGEDEAVLTAEGNLGAVRAASTVCSFRLSGRGAVNRIGAVLTDGEGREAVCSPAAFTVGEDGTAVVSLDSFVPSAPGFSFLDACRLSLRFRASGEFRVGAIRVAGAENVVAERMAALLTEAPLTPGNGDRLSAAVLELREEVTRVFSVLDVAEHRCAVKYFPDYFRFDQLCVEARAYAEAKGGIWVTAGQALPIGNGRFYLGVRVKNRSGRDLKGLSLGLRASVLFFDALPERIFDLAAGASASLVLTLVPRTGGVCAMTVSVTDADGEKMAERVRFIRMDVDGDGWYSGDLHSHSTRSDGSGLLAMNFYSAYRKGDSFLYATDHNQPTSVTFDVAQGAKALTDNGITDFTPIKGCEITVYGPSGHVLNYNCDADYLTPPTGRTEEDIRQWNAILAGIDENGGLSYLAHPFCRWFNFPGMSTGEQATYGGDWNSEGWPKRRDGGYYTVTDAVGLYHGYTGIEIHNYDCGRAEGHYIVDNCLEFWDRENLLGERKIFGSTGTDAHDPAGIAECHNFFLVPRPTARNIINALGNGSFYPSTGPAVRVTLDGVGMGGTVIAAEKREAVLSVRAEAADAGRGPAITRVLLYRYKLGHGPKDNEAAYRAGTVTELLDPACGGVPCFSCRMNVPVEPGVFFRVEVRTAVDLSNAYANPIWVTAGASRFAFAAHELVLRPGEHARLRFETDDPYDTPVLTSDSDAITVYDYGKAEVSPSALPGDYHVTAVTASGRVDRILLRVVGSEADA